MQTIVEELDVIVVFDFILQSRVVLADMQLLIGRSHDTSGILNIVDSVVDHTFAVDDILVDVVSAEYTLQSKLIHGQVVPVMALNVLQIDSFLECFLNRVLANLLQLCQSYLLC